MDPVSAATGGKVLEQLVTVYGPPGLIIAVLMLVIWRLFNLYIGEVDKGRERSIAYVESMNKITTAVEGIKDLLRMRGDNK